jgi:hypothetical protein
MKKITIKPGQLLELIVQEQDGNLPRISVDITHDLLVNQFVAKKKTKRAPSSEGAKFSKYVGLACKAIETGMWTSGVAISPGKVLLELLSRFSKLPRWEYSDVTSTARENLDKLGRSNHRNIVIRDMIEALKQEDLYSDLPK